LSIYPVRKLWRSTKISLMSILVDQNMFII